MKTSHQNAICLLGRFLVQVDGQPLKWARRKTQAMIAYLAVRNAPCSRDTLAVLLWPENDNARALLRRSLTELNQSPISRYLRIERNDIQLVTDSDLFVDALAFAEICQRADPDDVQTLMALYGGRFLEGFSLPDSDTFDEWQTLTAQHYEVMMERITMQLGQGLLETQQYDGALQSYQWLLQRIPMHEGAVQALIQLYQQFGLRHMAARLAEEHGQPLGDMLTPALAAPQPAQIADEPADESPGVVLPQAPALVIGREHLSLEIVAHLCRDGSRLVLQGWPGIGKTTLTAMIARNRTIRQYFSDGVLWASLGESPDLLAPLAQWAAAVNVQIAPGANVEQAASQLRSALAQKRVLVIIDDVWSIEHAQPLLVGCQEAAYLLTTRFNDVAIGLMLTPGNLWKVPILNEKQSLDLLAQLAPEVIAQHREAAMELVHDLEGLPLALQVAGRLLHEESAMGWDVRHLITEMRETRALLEAQAPADRMDIATQTTPTIAALLQRSVVYLTDETQRRFAMLGVFAPKPATFTLQAIQAVWETDEVRDSVRQLVSRGLLEPIGRERFQMHALLVMLARDMVNFHGDR